MALDEVIKTMFTAQQIEPGWEEYCPVRPTEARSREDNLWMINCGILVLAMNAAFGLLEAGTCKLNNTLNIMMKNIGDMVVGGCAWWVIGYSIAFCSTEGSCSAQDWPKEVDDEAFWFFQWTFAATAATIDSGALAERVAFIPYLFLSTFTTGVVYPYVVSWYWGGGFLYQYEVPFQDFAGGALVHLLGGCSAVVVIAIVGPRIGRYSDYKPSQNRIIKLICRRSSAPDYYVTPVGAKPIQPVTDGISIIWGTFFLWIGWYGFNPGGVVQIEGRGTYTVARICVNTTLGALGGGMCAMLSDIIYSRGRTITPSSLATGILSGLVSITAGCKYFTNGVSFVLGFVGYLVALLVERCLHKLHLDDVVNAIPVHFGGGLFGTIAIGFFAKPWPCTANMGDTGPVGVFYAETLEEKEQAWDQVAVQCWGCLCISAWSMATTFLLVSILNQVPFLRLRLERSVELAGLDEDEHGLENDMTMFQGLIEQMVSKLATACPDERSRDIYRDTVQRMMMTHMMDGQSESSLTKKQTATLMVTVGSFVGTVNPGVAMLQCFLGTQGIRVLVEIVAAERNEGSSEFKRYHSFFAPRKTKTVKHAPFDFNDDFIFENFTVPVGVEDHLFAVFSVVLNGVAIGYAPVNVADALAQTDGVNSEITVDLVPCEAPVRCSGTKTHLQDGTLSVKICTPEENARISVVHLKLQKTRSLAAYSDGRMPEELESQSAGGHSEREQESDMRQTIQRVSDRLEALEDDFQKLLLEKQVQPYDMPYAYPNASEVRPSIPTPLQLTSEC